MVTTARDDGTGQHGTDAEQRFGNWEAQPVEAAPDGREDHDDEHDRHEQGAGEAEAEHQRA
jgi:hypothetical protein